MRPPDFWWQAPPRLAARALAPLAALYGAASGRRLARGPRASADAAVLCVGNFTVGGAGKTPTALALARAALDLGLRPGFLSRGYGREDREPMRVDPRRHGVREAGDEPLLLARLAPTVVAADRAAGAALLGASGADLILMDDGFQSAGLRADLALLVVDGMRGLGNGRVLPAGPLRAPLGAQIERAGAILVVGEGAAGAAAGALGAAAGLPVHRARLAPLGPRQLAGRRVLAFSGIADPGKFHRSLGEAGASLAGTRDFPDHHPFTRGELAALRREAEALGAVLVTTAKDRARIAGPDGGAGAGDFAAAFLGETLVLEVEMRFEEADAPRRLIEAALAAFATRRGAASGDFR